MTKLFRIIMKQWLPFLLLAAAIVVQAFSELALPQYTSDIVNHGIGAMRTDYILTVGLTMTGYALLALLGMVGSIFFSSKIGAYFARETRTAVFKKALSFSKTEYDYFTSASLITRCTNDIQQAQTLFTMTFRMMLFAPIMGIGALSKVLFGESSLALILAAAVGVIILVVLVMFLAVMPKFRIVQKTLDRLNLISREILSGLPVIRSFAGEKREIKRFDDVNYKYMKLNVFTNRAMSIMFPTMTLIMNGVSVLIVWYGSKAVDAGNLMVGDLLAMISYSMQVIMSFLVISMVSIMLPRSLISFRRIGEVLDKEISVADPINPISFSPAGNGILEFKNVTFAYENADEPALNNISFSVSKGETVGIIGSTGCGKSTVANLIPRFFDPTKGEILLDGFNIKDVSLNELRKRIGFVPQKAMLLSGTIASNIAFPDKKMKMEQIELAAKTAKAREFIKDREDGYESYISQRGGNVSGGQRQRLSIARAIAKNPDIFVFDDSFSALDYKTDRALRTSLKNLAKEKSVIIIAQRISTVMDANRIIVLEDGNVVGIGNHKKLMEECSVYRDIAYSQLSESELQLVGKELQ